MDDRSGEVDHGFEALICFIRAHGDALELVEFTEEVFDQVPPFIHFRIDFDGFGAAWMLRYDDFGAALIEVGDDGVAVKSLVGEQGAELDPREERCDTDSVEALPRQENEAHELAKRNCHSEDLGGHSALGAAYGLILSPPFAPCP